MGDLRDHWEGVYSTKADSAVSWYQRHSSRSLAFIAASAEHTSPIIDVGGGASTLIDDLLAAGYTDLTVLDLASASLAKAKERLGDRADQVNWVVADITRWHPPTRFKVWHDRAVFHFLTDPQSQSDYLRALHEGTGRGSTAIMATFALDGPEKCSGLPVQRYSPKTLAVRIGPEFTLIDEAYETHRTPWSTEQRFAYSVFRRR